MGLSMRKAQDCALHVVVDTPGRSMEEPVLVSLPPEMLPAVALMQHTEDAPPVHNEPVFLAVRHTLGESYLCARAEQRADMGEDLQNAVSMPPFVEGQNNGKWRSET